MNSITFSLKGITVSILIFNYGRWKILIDRRWHSSVLDVRRFEGADRDTGTYLVVAKVRERLAVSKRAAQRFDGGKI